VKIDNKSSCLKRLIHLIFDTIHSVYQKLKYVFELPFGWHWFWFISLDLVIMINARFRDNSNIIWLMCATWLHIFKNFVKFVEELMLSNRLIFDRWNTSDSDWKYQRVKTGRIQIESDRIEPNTNLSIRVFSVLFYIVWTKSVHFLWLAYMPCHKEYCWNDKKREARENNSVFLLWCWYSPAGVVPTHEIPIFHKVWSKGNRIWGIRI